MRRQAYWGGRDFKRLLTQKYWVVDDLLWYGAVHTKDTIEERMMQLQEKKRLVFEGCMDGNQAALAQLTEEDLQFLFKR